MKGDSVMKCSEGRNETFVPFLVLCDGGHLGIFCFKHPGENSGLTSNGVFHSIVFQEAKFFSFLPALPVF